MPSNCKICYKPLPIIKHNRQVYCSDTCKKIGKDTANRVQAQRLAFERIKNGIECKRCKGTFYELGMLKYCKECSKIMNGKKICIDCGEHHSREKTDRCMSCATARAKKQRAEHNAIHNSLNKGKHRQPCRGCGCKLGDDIPPQNRYCSDECKEASKPKKQSPSAPKNPKKKDKPEIDPFFLTRGTPSKNGNGSSMDSGFTG